MLKCLVFFVRFFSFFYFCSILNNKDFVFNHLTTKGGHFSPNKSILSKRTFKVLAKFNLKKVATLIEKEVF
jgi:hypothetical protein